MSSCQHSWQQRHWKLHFLALALLDQQWGTFCAMLCCRGDSVPRCWLFPGKKSIPIHGCVECRFPPVHAIVQLFGLALVSRLPGVVWLRTCRQKALQKAAGVSNLHDTLSQNGYGTHLFFSCRSQFRCCNPNRALQGTGQAQGPI